MADEITQNLDQPQIVNPDELVASLESESKVETQAPVQAPPPVPQVVIPDKFKGKSVDEIIKGYQELESKFGKQGSELGELRKLADDFIKTQQPVQNAHQTDYSGSEQDFVKQAVERELAPIKEDVVELRRVKLDTKLKEIEPDYMSLVSTEGFQKWVMESPIRIELFARTDRNYDPNAGVELLKMYKAYNPVTAAPDTSHAMAEAAMETSSTHEAPSKKTYRRADIINLKLKNPGRYAALQNEIMQAYAEGRVV